MRASVGSYWLELRLFARSMAKMKNLNQTPNLMDSIVDNDWAVDQFTDPRPLRYDPARPRQSGRRPHRRPVRCAQRSRPDR